MTPRQIRIVDVFTERALAGNQLAVVLDGRDLPADLMQRIAREMNFSETTFVLPPENPAHSARVRIFTPGAELRFAGHPTIGTAWVLIDEGLAAGDGVILEEGIGPVKVRSVKESGQTMLWMTFPDMSFGQVYPHARVAAAIGLQESAIVGDAPAQIATSGTPFLFVALRDPRTVDAAVPELARLKKLLRDQAVG
ncbi:MAG TPA: PhzF family phenazine biosynthesis protein, partial [Candidatus Limnocylindrales bacterium]|nr:PhzF family phenazine biosynthesis protein [Candidatus Limnocylindrales bacterium]